MCGRTMSIPNLAEIHRPYLIVADFPGQMPRAISRTCHKEDADDQIRFLKRQVANGSFYVVYDPDPIRLRYEP